MDPSPTKSDFCFFVSLYTENFNERYSDESNTVKRSSSFLNNMLDIIDGKYVDLWLG